VSSLQGNKIPIATQIFISFMKNVHDRIFLTDARLGAVKNVSESLQGAGIHPGTSVPIEILDRDDSQNATNTERFLKEFASGAGSLRRAKALLVGEAAAGKTSLFNALSTGESRLVPAGADRATAGVKVSELVFPSDEGFDGSLSMWDFGGQIEYYATHAFFLTRRSIVLLVVDLYAYNCNELSFEQLAGRWLRILEAQLVAPEVVLVGTKLDRVSAEAAAKKMQDIEHRIEDHIQVVQKKLSLRLNRMRKYQEWRLPDEDLSEEERRTRGIAQVRLVHSLSLSSYSLEGVAELKGHLRKMATVTRNEGGAAFVAPKSFEELLEFLVAETEKQPYIDLRVIEQNSTIENRETIHVALRLFRDMGLIVWLEDMDALDETVFIRPQWIVDVLKAIVRHDMFETEDPNTPGRIFQLEDLSESVVSEMKKGLISLDVLELLWDFEMQVQKELVARNALDPKDALVLSKDDRRVATNLLLSMDLCRRYDDAGTRFRFPFFIAYPDGEIKRRSRPRESLLRRMSEAWSKTFKLSRIYNFYVLLPFGLFNRLLARLPPYFDIALPSKPDEIRATVDLDDFVDPVRVTLRRCRSHGKHTGYIQLVCASHDRSKASCMQVFTSLVRAFNELLAQYLAVPFECLLLHDIIGKPLTCIPLYEFQSKVRANSNMREYGTRNKILAATVDLPFYEWQDEGELLFDANRKPSIEKAVRLDLFSPAEYLVQSFNDRDLFVFKQQMLHKLSLVSKRGGRNVRLYIESLLASAMKKLPGRELHKDDPLKSTTRESLGELISFTERVVHRISLPYDIFLSYSWSRDRFDRDNSARVKDLARVLNDTHGLRVWIDDKSLHTNESGRGSDIVAKTLDGLNKSLVFGCCLTERYMEKVNHATEHDIDDYCHMELTFAREHRSPSHRLPIIMEPELQNPSFRNGAVAGAFQNSLFCKMWKGDGYDDTPFKKQGALVAKRVLELHFPASEDQDNFEVLHNLYKA